MFGKTPDAFALFEPCVEFEKGVDLVEMVRCKVTQRVCAEIESEM